MERHAHALVDEPLPLLPGPPIRSLNLRTELSRTMFHGAEAHPAARLHNVLSVHTCAQFTKFAVQPGWRTSASGTRHALPSPQQDAHKRRCLRGFSARLRFDGAGRRAYWSQSERGLFVGRAKRHTSRSAVFEQPLGFALYGGAQASDNVPLQMQALVCRLLIALLGKPGCSYVKTPANTRQRFGLDLA